MPSHHISCKQRARFLLVLVRRQKYSPKLLLYVYDRWLLLFLERKKALRKLRFLFVLVVILPVVLITRSSGSQSHARADNPIQHIIFIVKENHTFDNYFGLFPGANGTTVGYAKIHGVKTQIPLNPGQDTPSNYTHLWHPAHTAYDNGQMDAFNVADGRCGSIYAHSRSIQRSLRHSRLYPRFAHECLQPPPSSYCLLIDRRQAPDLSIPAAG